MKEQNVKDIHMIEAIITTSAVTNMIGSIPEALHTIITGGTATPGIIQRTHTAGNPNYYGTGLPEQPPAFLFGFILGYGSLLRRVCIINIDS